MADRRARRLSPSLALSLALLVFALVCLALVLVMRMASGNAWAGRELYIHPDSPAARAVSTADTPAEAAAFEEIANTPAAVWLEPEQHGVEDVGDFVASIAVAAASDASTAVFVVYGIPNRDCGNQSKGGLTADDYPIWLTKIAEALEDTATVVILEPDSLALASECGNLDERLPQLSQAIDILSESGTTIYLDGGHSDWLSADTMADILERAGVDRVRGFATNISNYNSTADEVEYADRVSELTSDAHYVIDTSRNGNGSNGQWCNPVGRALGAQPRVDAGQRLDAELWIKNPGESDGTCGGGPAAGVWWDEAALQLAAG